MRGNSIKRKNIRLKNYDYSRDGYYFVTICTHGRAHLFGEIKSRVGPEMVLNECGNVMQNIWDSLPQRFPIYIDEFQIMPNHVHFIIQIVGVHHGGNHVVGAIHESPIVGVYQESRINGAHRDAPLRKRPLLAQIIGYFKMNTTKIIHKTKPNMQIWQRNYHEHIIRTENDLQKIRDYIKTNPYAWERDENNPKNIKK